MRSPEALSDVDALLSSYVAQDRRRALAAHRALAEHPSGAALLADLAGSTAMAAELVARSGPRQGAESLTHLLDQIYTALIDAVEQYGGSVISFAGDAIMCWFEQPSFEFSVLSSQLEDEDTQHSTLTTENSAALCAAACGLAMQDALRALPGAPGLKVAITAGRCRRSLVGDPALQQLDVAAGPCFERLAALEGCAAAGDVLVDTALAQALGEAGVIAAWDETPTGVRYGHLVQLQASVAPARVALPQLDAAVARPFVAPPLAERLARGEGEFTAELRPVALLFVGFAGFADNDDQQAGERLDRFVAWAQHELANNDGLLIQLTGTNDGGYFYAVFGAASAREDDRARAAVAALALCRPPPQFGLGATRIGLSWGVMRTGAYGSASRRTYGVLGSEANIAARLMQLAGPGEIIASAQVASTLPTGLHISIRPAHTLKGLAEPVPVYQIHGRRATHPPASTNEHAMHGRVRERALLAERLVALRVGEGGALMIEGEPGIGKSRLLHELLGLAHATGVRALSGAAEAIEQSTPYYAWRPIVAAVLEAAAGNETPQAPAWLTSEPWFAARAPLLNALLASDIPETEFSRQLAGQTRAETTNELIIRLLERSAAGAPLLLALEDVHWLDSASWALALAVLQQLPTVLLATTTRPLAAPPAEATRLLALPGALLLQLSTLPADASTALICDALDVRAIAPAVASTIAERAEGNPFFTVELALALRESGVISIRDGEARLAADQNPSSLELPATIHAAVTSRIDRLPPGQQVALKIASVIGRQFAYTLLDAVHPPTLDRQWLPQTLEALDRERITTRVANTAEPSYLFRHVIIQQAAYDLLLNAQRRALHQAVAEWYEQHGPAEQSAYYPLLAFHWKQADQTERARRYLELAGAQALEIGAYREAIAFFQAALAELPQHARGGDERATLERATIQRQLGAAYFGLGELAAARTQIEGAVVLLGASIYALRPQYIVAGALRDLVGWSWRQFENRRTSATKAATATTELELARCYLVLGSIYAYESANLPALHAVVRSLRLLAPQHHPAAERAYSLAEFGLVAANLAFPRLARHSFVAAARASEQSHDRAAQTYALWIRGLALSGRAEWDEAEQALEQAVALAEALNDRRQLGEALNFLQLMRYHAGNLSGALEASQQLYDLTRRTENHVHRLWAMNGRGVTLIRCGATDEAIALLQETQHKLGELAIGGGTHCAISDGLVTGYLRRGWLDDARLMVVDLDRRISRPITITYIEGMGLGALADVALALYAARPHDHGLRVQARRACRELQWCAGTYPAVAPRAWRSTGELAWIGGDTAGAVHAFERSLARATELHMPYDSGLAHAALGRVRRNAARQEHLRMAIALFSRVGAAHDLRAAVAAARDTRA
jgi:class 3 adenylate cyclase/tetratricopeptide (TPR) repeat protein